MSHMTDPAVLQLSRSHLGYRSEPRTGPFQAAGRPSVPTIGLVKWRQCLLTFFSHDFGSHDMQIATQNLA